MLSPIEPKKVYDFLNLISSGKVVTYAQLVWSVGVPVAARTIGKHCCQLFIAFSQQFVNFIKGYFPHCSNLTANCTKFVPDMRIFD